MSLFTANPPHPKAEEATLSKNDAQVYRQQPHLAGLFVTQELDKAIARCKAKVEDIAQECRGRNRRFRDIEFDLEHDEDFCLHGLDTPEATKFKPGDVLRVPDIFENPQFVIDGVEYSDIEQGGSGDCWFMSALATLSTMPGLIDKICVARDEQVGIYGFIFFRDGEWADVIIDDQLFTSVPKYETLSETTQNLYHKDKDLYNKVARKGSKTLFFGRSTQENETWVPLLEKAYAKFHGDYVSLNGGFSFQALEDLTGGVSQVVYTNDIFDKDKFWHEDLMKTTKDRLFGCYLKSLAGKGSATGDTKINGLWTAHAYSILRAIEYNGKRFLKIRNPWGRSEWTGRWSDGSKEWTKEWFKVLDILDHKFGDDGEFIMEYGDFLETWYAIDRTIIFDASWVQSAHWLNVASRSFPCAWQFGDVSFTFSLPKASLATIVLAQWDTRFFTEISGYSMWSFDFLLFKKGSELILGRSEFCIRWPRSVALHLDLGAGEYVLHVRLDRNYLRQRSYMKDGLAKWDHQKLSKVLSKLAESSSLAANFDAEQHRYNLVVPLKTFAGRDITELEIRSFEAATRERQAIKDRYQFRPPQVITKTAAYGEKSAKKDDSQEGSDKPPVVDATSTEPVKADVEVPNPETTPEQPETKPETKPETMQVTESAVVSAPTDPLDTAVPKDGAETTSAGDDQGPKVLQPDGPVHEGITCDGCKKSVVGVRWKCLVCENYDLCDSCHGSGVQSMRHSVKHNMQRTENPKEHSFSHNIICDGCRVNPLPGVRWVCLGCVDFDLCDACHSFGVHPADHKMLRIADPNDANVLKDLKDPDEDNSILLGLRVYTKDYAPVTISGQLRHGSLVSMERERRRTSI